MKKIAIVFPGQGSQAVGMLAELAEKHAIIKETFSEASSALDYDLWSLTQTGPEEELNKTWKTQPALLAASVAIFRLWTQLQGPSPVLVAGHSLGEYSALVCSEVVKFTDAIKLVELRGKFMQEAVPAGSGAMYAIIGLSDDLVEQACQKAAQSEVVSPVNFNSPGQVVIAGTKSAVERAAALCKESGAKRALPLPVSVPSHCALMKPAAEKLSDILATISLNTPKFDIVNNVDAKIERSAEGIRTALIRQLYSSVLWTKSVEFMSSQGIELLIEMGPGKVLTGLTKRIVPTLSGLAVNDEASLITAIETTK